MSFSDLINVIRGNRVNSELPESRPITDSPVSEESAITFSIRKHGNGKYSCKISQVPCEDKELDDYAKWLAGSLARSMMKFEELVGVDDPDGVANAKCPFSKD